MAARRTKGGYTVGIVNSRYPRRSEVNKQKLMATRTGQLIPKPRIRKRKKR